MVGKTEGAWVILLYIETNTHTLLESHQGRNRVADRVDVIGVRSVSEAAENQSFLRTTGVACF